MYIFRSNYLIKETFWKLSNCKSKAKLEIFPPSFVIVHEKLEKQEKKQEIQDEEVEEQEKALEKQLTAKGIMPVSDQIAVFAVDVNKKKEEFMPTKSKKRNKGWSVAETFSFTEK